MGEMQLRIKRLGSDCGAFIIRMTQRPFQIREDSCKFVVKKSPLIPFSHHLRSIVLAFYPAQAHAK